MEILMNINSSAIYVSSNLFIEEIFILVVDIKYINLLLVLSLQKKIDFMEISAILN